MANIFNWMDYSKPGKGIDKEAAKNQNPFIRYFRIYFQRFINLVNLNILVFILSAPIITAPMAFFGMTKVTRDYAREKETTILGDFFKTIKNNIKQIIPISLINLFVTAVLGLAFYVYVFKMPATDNFIYQLGMGFLVSVSVLFVFMNFYIYTLTITFDLKLKDIYRNSLILSILGLGRNFCALVISGIAVAVFVIALLNGWYFIYLTLALFLLFSFVSYTVQFFTFRVIKKHMIDPYNKLNGITDEEDDGGDEEDRIFSDSLLD